MNFPGTREAGPLGQLSLWSNDAAERAWRVRVSERARRMTIRVFAGGRVEVVVPRWARAGAIERFVHQHRAWTERKVLELSSRVPPSTALPERLELAMTGERFTISYRNQAWRPRIAKTGEGIEIVGDRAREAEIRELLRQWLIERARERLAPWLEQVSRDTGLAFRSLQVRRQRTRWGSCSVRGTISLNCCLLFQRAEVVRYLLVHELAHTRHMNHSLRFWRLVSAHEPHYRPLDRELVQGWQNVPSWVFTP